MKKIPPKKAEKEKIRKKRLQEKEKKRIERYRKKTHRSPVIKWTLDLLIIIIGSFIYAFAFHTLTVPNDIAPGGVTGIATIINFSTDLPVGVLYGLINLPIVIIGIIFLSKSTMIKTLISVVIITFATDWLFVELPVYTGNVMLASIFSGVLFGAGLGVIYSVEGTSGGVDIINKLIRKRVPHISMGKIMVAMDAVIVLASIIVFNSIESGLYAIISIFVSSKVVDTILYGGLEGKLLLIFSDNYQEIADKIIVEQDRGVTLLQGYGGYSGQEKRVICCAVQKSQYVKIKRIVSEADPLAFIVITNAGEVLGEGFSENKIG